MDVRCATEDGSYGRKGLVTDLLQEALGDARPPMLYSCGPSPMLRRVAEIARPLSVPHQVSLERRMGCGMGCCLGCVVYMRTGDGVSEYLRSCSEGPVFEADAVCWEHESLPSMTSRASQDHPDLSVEIAGIHLKAPLIAASGTFGYGTEYLELADYEAIGAIAVKGLYLEPRDGCRPPRIWETPSGMLNAIGLQEVGIERFLDEKLPRLRELQTSILVNICGSSVEEYAELARLLDTVEGISGIEMNISCPNVHEGGILFGCDPDMAAYVTEAVRKRPVFLSFPS